MKNAFDTISVKESSGLDWLLALADLSISNSNRSS